MVDVSRPPKYLPADETNFLLRAAGKALRCEDVLAHHDQGHDSAGSTSAAAVASTTAKDGEDLKRECATPVVRRGRRRGCRGRGRGRGRGRVAAGTSGSDEEATISKHETPSPQKPEYIPRPPSAPPPPAATSQTPPGARPSGFRPHPPSGPPPPMTAAERQRPPPPPAAPHACMLSPAPRPCYMWRAQDGRLYTAVPVIPPGALPRMQRHGLPTLPTMPTLMHPQWHGTPPPPPRKPSQQPQAVRRGLKIHRMQGCMPPPSHTASSGTGDDRSPAVACQ